jgi:class 3 adenylate cyclase
LRAGGGAELPAGTVAFLLTDIEGSARLWESVPDAMEIALEQHNRLVNGMIESHGGVVVTSRGEGDSFSPSLLARFLRSRRPAPASCG